MDEFLNTQRMGPSSLTQQLTSKQESSSNLIDQGESIKESPQEPHEFKSMEMNQSRVESKEFRKHAIFLTNRTLKTMQPQKQSNFMQNFKIQLHVHRFINNIFTNSYILRSSQKNKINDKLLEKPLQQQRKKLNFENKKYLIPIFLPSTNYIMLWDIVGFFCHLLMLWLTPFLGAFNHYRNYMISLIQEFIFAFLMVDIIIHFNKGIFQSAVLIRSRKKIVKQYLKTTAFSDFLKLIIWADLKYDVLFSDIYETAIVIQIILIYMSIQRYLSEYFQIIQWKGSQNFVIDLVQLIIQIYYFAHIIACVWFYVGQKTQYLGTSWIIENNLEDSSVWSQYNCAFYWASMTMTTVGYGDIAAKNQVEMILSSVIMFFSSYAFAYTMSSIGLILKNIYDAKQNYKKCLIQITQFMNKNQVDESIQGRVRNYLRLQLAQEKGENNDEINTLINLLPNNLQQDLNTDIQTRMLKKMKLIINHFSKYTQQLVAKNLELISFIPGDIIYKQGDQHEDYLYFIESGEVQQSEQQTNYKLRSLKAQQYLGFFTFFTGFPPKETAISQGHSQLYRINRKKFLEIIRQNQKDYEIFHHIKDRMIFKTNFVLFDHKCNFCQRYIHQEYDCPLISYKPDLEALLKKENFSNQIQKRMFRERSKGKLNALSQNKEVQKSLEDYILEKQLNGDLEMETPQNLQQQKSFFSEQQGTSSQALYSDEEQQQHNEQSSHDIRQNQQRTTKHPMTLLKLQKRSSFSKMKIGQIEQKQSQRRNILQNEDIAIPRNNTMIEEIYLIFQRQFKVSFNLDKLGNSFQYYMPQYSIESQIKLIAKSNRKKSKRFWKLQQRIEKYSFSSFVKEMGVKLIAQTKKLMLRSVNQL